MSKWNPKEWNWKKIGKIGVPVAAGVALLVIAYFGITRPSEADDPVARSGVAALKQDNAGLHTDLVDITKKQGDLAGRTDAIETAVNDPETGLVALTDGLAKRDSDLQAAIDDRPTKTDVTAEISGAVGTAVGTETTARTAADDKLAALVESVVKALHDPADPAAGVVGRLQAVEEHFSSPPIPQPGQMHPQPGHPVR